MNKSLLAVAVLSAFAGVAQAQSNVKMFGSIDGGVRYLDNVNSAGDSKTSIGSIGGLGADRIGFSGTEDLGNGLKANWHLETGFNIGTGALDNAAGKLFNRTAKVGLSGAWGAVDIGHQYGVNFHTLGLYEPFKLTHFSFTGIIPGVKAAAGTSAGMTATNRFGTFGGARFDNDVQYTGKFNGFTFSAEHALGELAGSANNGAASAIGLSYAGGPFAVGAAYTTKKANISVAAAPASWQDATQLTAGGAYRMGKFRFTVGIMNDKQETGSAVPATKVDNTWAGVNYFISPGLYLTAAHYLTDYKLGNAEGKKRLTMASLVKELSKRTKLYVEADHSTFDGVAVGAISPVGQRSQNGFSIGMFHQF